MLITEDLILDVSRLLNILFDKDSSVTERRKSFLTRELESLNGLLIVESNTHTLSTTTSGCLNHDGVSDFTGDFEDFLVRVDLTKETWDCVDFSLTSEFLRLDLISHGLDGTGWRADEFNLVVEEKLLESAVLREEAVTWVDGLCSSGLDDFKDGVHTKIGVLGGRGSYTIGLISLLNEHGVHIGIGIDGDSLNTHLLCCLDDSASDFTTVSDKNLVESLGEGLASVVDLAVR